MSYFPFDLKVSTKRLGVSLFILGVAVSTYIQMFRRLNTTGFLIFGLIIITAFLYFTYNCLASVTVDTSYLVINTLLKKDVVIEYNDIKKIKKSRNRLTIYTVDGKKYKLPAGLNHTKKLEDTIKTSLSIRSGKKNRIA